MRGTVNWRVEAPPSPARTRSSSSGGALSKKSRTVIIGWSFGFMSNVQGPKSKVRFLDPGHWTPGPWTGALRLDQAEVAVLAFVQHSHAVCIRVAKDKELICLFRQAQRGFLGRHGFHRIAARCDHARRPGTRL